MILQEIPPLVVANQYSVGHLPGGRVMQLVLLMDIVTDWLTWTCGTLRLTRLLHSLVVTGPSREWDMVCDWLVPSQLWLVVLNIDWGYLQG